MKIDWIELSIDVIIIIDCVCLGICVYKNWMGFYLTFCKCLLKYFKFVQSHFEDTRNHRWPIMGITFTKGNHSLF